MRGFCTTGLSATFAALVALLAPATVARADIFQWEYIDPANPSLGRQQSTTLAPDGAAAQAVPGANLSNRNLTKAYLRGAHLGALQNGAAGLRGADLTGANLSHADLTQANLSGYWFYDYDAPYQVEYYFSGTNLSAANLTNANFEGANLYEAILRGADTRGALELNVPPPAFTTIIANLIQTDGHIEDLNLGSNLGADDLLIVRDYDGNPDASLPTGELPIVVDQQFMMSAGGALWMEFDADAWSSTISFEPGIPVARDGTLELTFAAGVDPASQLGRTFDLFNWDGVSPTGSFTVSSEYLWDLTDLYTTGEVTLVSVVPEPSGLLLTAVGFVSLFAVAVLKRRGVVRRTRDAC